MRNSYTQMKRCLMAALVAASAMTATSCLRDSDLEILRHPIQVEGSISPNFALPLAYGQMSFEDLMSNLGPDFSGYFEVDNNNAITVVWDGEYGETIYPLSNILKNKKQKRSSRPAPKDDPYVYYKDTVISQTIPIPLFDNADLEQLANSSMELGHLWLSLNVSAYAEPADLAQHVSAYYSELLVTYIDSSGAPRQFDPMSSVTEVEIENLRDTLNLDYGTVDVSRIVNSYPRQIDISFRLKLMVKSSILYADWENYTFRQMMDSIAMTRLTYSIGAQVRVPFNIKVNHFTYRYDMDLGSGTSEFNLDSIIGQLSSDLHVDVDSLKLVIDFENRIPLNLSIDAMLLDGNGIELTHLFDDRTIKSAGIQEIDDIYDTSCVAFKPTLTSIPLLLKNEDIDNLRRARTMRLRVSVDSQREFVIIQREDFLRIRASLQAAANARFNYTVTDNGLI